MLCYLILFDAFPSKLWETWKTDIDCGRQRRYWVSFQSGVVTDKSNNRGNKTGDGAELGIKLLGTGRNSEATFSEALEMRSSAQFHFF